jgi:hypothetical protein
VNAAAIKRLRFAYDPSSDESVCGAFTAACHDQRLRTIASGLEGAGLKLSRPAHLQFADEPILAAAAAAMRTDPARLRAIAFAPGNKRDTILLGDLAVPRTIIDLDRRRIAPLTLADRPHHRAAWLNLLLPYCPESLEVIVDQCPACGPLGWRHTKGIANCEGCGQLVPRSPDAPLQAAMTDEYRAVADLLSRESARADAALKRMPYAVALFSRTTIASIMIRAGLIARRARSGWAIEALTEQPSSVVAAAMCSGYRIVTGWPGSIQTYAEQQADKMGHDIKAYEQLRRDLKWIAGKSEEGRAMIAMAFPKIDGRTADTFAGATRYYTASQTSAILWTASNELRRLRDAQAVDYETLPSNVRLRARYKADDVDALRELLDDVVTPGSAASDLDLPTYAMEQLAAEELVQVHNEPGVVALRGPQLAAGSVRTLIATLMGRRIKSTAPSGYVKLRTALAGYPGEKPWGAALKAILDEAIPFHLVGNELSIRQIAIAPGRLPDLARPSTEPGRLRVTHLSMRDAVEVLVSKEQDGAATIRSACPTPTRHKQGLGIARTELARLVAKVAFTGEAAVHRNRNAIKLHHEFTSIGVPREHGAWSREALVELGMVKPFALQHANAAASSLTTQPSPLAGIAGRLPRR